MPGRDIWIGLGGNLGDRRRFLERALDLLSDHGISICTVSSLFETAPQEVTDQPAYLNAAAHCTTELSPESTLQELLAVEQQLGRTRLARWGPRIIDLDLLLYDGIALETPRLTIPHPRMWERAFVLIPLTELLPELHMPDGSLARQRGQALASSQWLTRVARPDWWPNP
ncbi:MAG: 2-amino-4-hydroxy-6-hydroxymethyldihydropteridine diphosphokinase [Chloroflexi bacterium]|nr:2-amino-4-hydroxy-6-hydroxymethyldihydropteridine diphosphokinase [Chloroflexota bacterium]